MYDIQLTFCDGHSEIRENVESYCLDMDSLALWYDDLEVEFYDRDSWYRDPKYSLESFKVVNEY